MLVLITGSAGFIGKHLVEALRRREGVAVMEYDLGSPEADLDRGLHEADVILHLAGINRPQSVEEFKTGNADFTAALCASLSALRRSPLFVMSSSIQAALENPYGLSKRQAEEAVERWAEGNEERAKAEELRARSQEPRAESEAVGTLASSRLPLSHRRAVIFRLKNVFGKWCRPNYNSVVATFCHNISHDLPITISDPNRELELVYIDDVVAAFLQVLDEAGRREQRAGSIPLSSDICPLPSVPYCCCREVAPTYKIMLGELAARIRSFRESRKTLLLPSLEDEFTRRLYATYLSYLDGPDFAYDLERKTDARGALAEFMKSAHFGQIFVSRTRPGITRGNHFHHTKTEKFLVVEGEAVIRLRRVGGKGQGAKGEEQETSAAECAVIEHRVNGREFKVVDIPPGYTHSIENVGDGDLVTLFWASEAFDPARPDTYQMAVT